MWIFCDGGNANCIVCHWLYAASFLKWYVIGPPAPPICFSYYHAGTDPAITAGSLCSQEVSGIIVPFQQNSSRYNCNAGILEFLQSNDE